MVEPPPPLETKIRCGNTYPFPFFKTPWILHSYKRGTTNLFIRFIIFFTHSFFFISFHEIQF
jgi:hypothetical protein